MARRRGIAVPVTTPRGPSCFMKIRHTRPDLRPRQICAGLLMLGGACAGVLLHRRLPDHHLNEHSKDIVRLGSALVATITALVLSLLITSAKNAYDLQRTEIKQIAATLH